MSRYLFIIAVLLAGCSGKMTREESIAAVKVCEDAGMTPAYIMGYGVEIVDVQCWPKELRK